MMTIERVRELEKIDAKEADDHRRVTARTVQHRTADKSVRDLLIEVNDPENPVP